MTTIQRLKDFWIPTGPQDTEIVVKIDGEFYELDIDDFGMRDYHDGEMQAHVQLEVGDKIAIPDNLHR